MDQTHVHVWIRSVCMYGSELFACMDQTCLHVWVRSVCMYGSDLFACMGRTCLHVWVRSVCMYGSDLYVFTRHSVNVPPPVLNIENIGLQVIYLTCHSI